MIKLTGEKVMHEMIRGHGRKGNTNMCIKVDLRKPFATVNRYFVIRMLQITKFSDEWIKLIADMIISSTFSIFKHVSAEG